MPVYRNLLTTHSNAVVKLSIWAHIQNTPMPVVELSILWALGPKYSYARSSSHPYGPIWDHIPAKAPYVQG